MHSSDLETYGKKCCYFWFHSEVKFLTRFDVFLDLVKFALFNAIPIDFYAVKSFICIIALFNAIPIDFYAVKSFICIIFV